MRLFFQLGFAQLHFGAFAEGFAGASQIHLRGADVDAPTSGELKSLYALDAIYEGKSNNASETDKDAGRAHKDVYNNSGDAAASIYGEIQPSAVLEMFKVTGVKEGQKYYDLGSGYGKTVVLAWLRGLNATGVELAQDRWESSCDALHRAPSVGVTGAGSGVNFIHASFFDVDFSDADLVFMDSVMFSEETMQELARMCRNLRPGAKIVSSHQGLPGLGFKKLGTLRGAVSWSHRKSRWTIQTVLPHAATLGEKSKKPSHAPKGKAQVCTISK